MKSSPLPVSGWFGAPSSDAQAAMARLAAARGQFVCSETQSDCHIATGSSWTCSAPSVAEQDGLVAGIRGEPIWRTDDTRITTAVDDAQAILRAYQIHGRGFLELLHGSFALVVLDTARHSTLLAIDRIGIERLAYCLRGSDLTFGTSSELVARSCGAEPSVRAQAVLSYIFFHMIPSPETVFEGVRKIPPATALLCNKETLTEYRYWQPNFIMPQSRAAAFSTLKASLHAALSAAVKATHPHERTGAFLSGGLDSSTVTGYLGKVTQRPARTFSIGFGVDKFDELRYARITNAHFGCDAREYEVRPDDIVDEFSRMAAQFDEPFGNASALPTLCCARLAKENAVDHLLAGDGGDELFAGNRHYAHQLMFERYQRVPRFLRQYALEPFLAAIPVALRIGLVRKAHNYVVAANTPLPGRLHSWNFLHRLGFETVLHPNFVAAVDLSEPEWHVRSVYEATSSASELSRMLEFDWRLTLADNDLRKVGRMCELAGIRVSYPMLHPDVIDVSMRVPTELMMRGRSLRTFYKRAMAGFLPAEIIAKPKHGFGLPFGLWLQRSPRLADFINESLTSLRARQIVRAEFLDRLIQLHREDDANYYGVLVWTLAMLEQWFREHHVEPR
jgi:asparagine synthase (glutamine-hydrolysing)